MPDTKTSEKKYIVHSLERGLEILELLAETNREMSVSEIANALKFSPSNTHKLLVSLKSTNYVAQNPENTKYMATLKLFKVGGALLKRFDIRTVALPIMKNLAEVTNTVACMVVQDGDDALCIEHAESSIHVPIIFLRRGEHLPMYIGAAALMLLAYLPEEEQDRLLSKTPIKAWTPATITDPEEIKAVLKNIKAEEYYICRDGVTMGVTAIAMPIYDWSAQVIASISIAGLSQDFSDDKISEKRMALQRAVKEMSMKTGPSY